MKNWKAIVSVVLVMAVIVTILAINKKKLAANTSGGIDITYYVTVENVAKKNLTSQLSLTGTIFANNDVNIMSETSGKVVAVYAKVGDYKQAGSVLCLAVFPEFLCLGEGSYQPKAMLLFIQFLH